MNNFLFVVCLIYYISIILLVIAGVIVAGLIIFENISCIIKTIKRKRGKKE